MPRKSAVAAAFPGTTSRLRPPDDLNELERAEFTSLVLALPADHFTLADVSTVAMYCRAVVAERIADGELSATPITPDGKASPWLSIWMGRVRAVTTLARRLRLNPAGSTPSKSAEAKDDLPISYYDKVALERRNDEHN